MILANWGYNYWSSCNRDGLPKSVKITCLWLYYLKSTRPLSVLLTWNATNYLYLVQWLDTQLLKYFIHFFIFETTNNCQILTSKMVTFVWSSPQLLHYHQQICLGEVWLGVFDRFSVEFQFRRKISIHIYGYGAVIGFLYYFEGCP